MAFFTNYGLQKNVDLADKYCQEWNSRCNLIKQRREGEVKPRTGHEGPEG
jgi:hypothetical protein